ncbi:MAG: MMPL family transporter, partial [Bacilli bacterium]
VLIFVLLIVIYRSLTLAIIPLVIASLVYGVVDRLLGIAGKNDWFVIDKSAVSIMLVLLFAVLTDYCLFIFSRYREELRKDDANQWVAMERTMKEMASPIGFSGGTVLMAVLALFVTVYKPYNYFAPTFSLALVVILLAGLTLIPAVYALLGKRAFWPFKLTEKVRTKPTVWHKIGQFSIKNARTVVAVFLVFFALGGFAITTMKTSFNTLASFPESMSSREGMTILSERFAPGDVAPTNVILTLDKDWEENEATVKALYDFQQAILAQEGVDAIRPLVFAPTLEAYGRVKGTMHSEDGKAMQFQVILDRDPFSNEAIAWMDTFRKNMPTFVKDASFSGTQPTVYISGSTAEQNDVKAMNERDTLLLMGIVTVLITAMLAWHTRSILYAVLMMGSILLSFGATIGIGWWALHYLFGYDALSYRMPLYTFVFMVALGVDYNIMLVSRIREEFRSRPWHEAIVTGVERTGGVISSAGVILAATFAVLITQPLEDLHLFGILMAFGIMMDTFLVRGLFLPSVLSMLNRKQQ